MTDATADAPEKPAKSSKLPVLLGLILALAGAGGGFFVAQSGLLDGGESDPETAAEAGADPFAQISYVPIEPMVVSLASDQRARHLKLAAQLEIFSGQEAQVTQMMPRIMDVLNGYLRAVEIADLEDSFALARLRAHMLRRIQVVVGPDRVRDFLITEFVLN